MRTRNGNDRDFSLPTQSNQAVSGVCYRGPRRVGDQSDFSICRELLCEFFGFLLFVELVIALERFLNSKMVQESDGVTRVFASDEIGLVQSVQSSLGDVAQIPDGCR